jgi:hypothetical protein
MSSPSVFMSSPERDRFVSECLAQSETVLFFLGKETVLFLNCLFVPFGTVEAN